MAVVFTVEDGTIIDGANSYVTVAYADDYLSIKADSSDWTALSDVVVQKYLMLATRVLDQRAKFPNTVPTDTTQSLRWPRQGAYDRDGESIPDDVIPQQIQEATVEIAFNFFNNSVDPNNPTQGATQGVVNKLKVGPIEIDYAQGVAVANHILPLGINLILYPLGTISGTGGSRAVPIRKA